MNGRKIHSLLAMALGFAAGMAFIVGCPFDEYADSGPPSASAAPNDSATCSQWDVQRRTLYSSGSIDLSEGWEPFAALPGDYDYSFDILSKRCLY